MLSHRLAADPTRCSIGIIRIDVGDLLGLASAGNERDGDRQEQDAACHGAGQGMKLTHTGR